MMSSIYSNCVWPDTASAAICSQLEQNSTNASQALNDNFVMHLKQDGFQMQDMHGSVILVRKHDSQWCIVHTQHLRMHA